MCDSLPSPPAPPIPQLSVIAPAHNEQENLAGLINELEQVLEKRFKSFEIIIVDDGSTDNTPDLLRRLSSDHPRLRAIRLTNTPHRRGFGQSAALCAGIRHARADIIITMDADGQNDPADIPALIEPIERAQADLVQGDRSGKRNDSFSKRASSVVGRLTRRALLGDDIRDTGCALRAMRREMAIALPLHLRGMHRFIPALARQMGFRVVEQSVNHRPRIGGRTKYGVRNRAIPGFIDCLGVWWLARRRTRIIDESVSKTPRPEIVVIPEQQPSPSRETAGV